MATTDLKYDPLEVDVELAKSYLKKNEHDIQRLVLPEISGDWRNASQFARLVKVRKLKEKITENTSLFCQLEYLMNNTPIDVTEKNIQLIVQYLSLLHPKYKIIDNSLKSIKLTRYMPLAALAPVTIYREVCCCEERSAVCHLFVKLCRESGFNICMKRKEEIIFEIITEPPDMLCTGIIAEKSDLDSAVDIFLSSSSSLNCLWRLHRIYVQESVYDSFKNIIDFKTKLKGEKIVKNVELKKSCSDLFHYEDKYFLCDFVGDVADRRLVGIAAIFVEAYRTNKELLSLIRKAGSVSLWSADVAEANEIAYGVASNFVWINDYGNFDGPPDICTPFYFQWNSIECDVPKHFWEKYQTWKTYDCNQRLSIIQKVFEEIEEIKGEQNVFFDSISKVSFNSVDVADGRICVVVESPVGIHPENRVDVETIHSLVKGNAVLCKNSFKIPYDKFLQAGVPLMLYPGSLFGQPVQKEETVSVNIHYYRYQNKVVVTNFGTIFAN